MVTPRSLLLAACLPALAGATEIDAPWPDALNPPTPVRYGGEISYRAVLGDAQLHFATARVDLPLFRTRTRTFTWSLSGQAGLTAIEPDYDAPTDIGAANPQVSTWFTFTGPQRSSHHSFGLLGIFNVNDTVGVWSTTSEARNTVATFYDGYVTTRWVDVSTRAELGLMTDFSPDISLIADVAAIAKVHRMVGVHAGFRLGTARGWTSAVGVAVRPVDGFEIDATATFLLGSPAGYPLEGLPVRPGVSLRLWDGLGSPRRR